MNVIAFLSQKGGSGKTTLSVHTAVAAEATGERVCVIDADPQESATAWASAREAGTPIVATAQAGELDAALRAAEGEGITLAVVDAPPHAAPAAGLPKPSVKSTGLPSATIRSAWSCSKPNCWARCASPS